jgi:Flp pilus assembly protein TadD
MPLLTALESAVAARPRDDDAWAALGEAYANLKRRDDALSSWNTARALNPACARRWEACATLLGELGRMDEAVAHFDRALALKPDSARVHAALGKMLVEAEIGEERAEQALMRCVTLDPGQTGSCTRLAGLLLARMPAEAAIATLDRAFEDRVPPGRIRAAVAAALLEIGSYESARTLLVACIDGLRGGDGREAAALLLKLVEAQICLGEGEAALETCARAAASAPSNGRCFVVHIEQLIRLDRLEEAKGVSRRRAENGLPFGVFRRVPKESAHPDWRGEPLEGKTVLFRAEAGAGDTVQFAVFASLFSEAGAKVVIETFPPFARLLQTLGGAYPIVTPYEETPPIDYDLHPAFSAMLLPWTWASRAARVPYLHPPAALSRALELRMGRNAGLRIGITWRGAGVYHQRDPHRRRAVPLASFAPLAALPGVTLYSLQFGPGAEEARSAPFPIETLPAGDFLDTAAAVEALDLIVSVDTGTAHVAGALGKPCCVLLPYRACWRWMLDRETPLFYPSVRLLRQTRAGDWTAVIGALVDSVARQQVHV